MPEFDEELAIAAPPEEVWKLLYDPVGFPRWWAGVGSVDTTTPDGYTLYPEGYPDFPMPQLLSASRADGVVRISCLVSDLVFEWRLSSTPDGATLLSAHVEIPAAESARLATQREVIHTSLHRLSALAAQAAGSSRG
ncbi:SRPBCC family protein [Streptacidiphilus rugosus]|uniref:SRPBCC family protein n=1 Tax=Streptacidiphilus rugosus TaxID=405783 RepID=UPI00068B6F7E|nr:SRPBCC family protein [Streptacidiphilus rugosus]